MSKETTTRPAEAETPSQPGAASAEPARPAPGAAPAEPAGPAPEATPAEPAAPAPEAAPAAEATPGERAAAAQPEPPTAASARPETSFDDAEAPPAGEPRADEIAEEVAQVANRASEYLALAQRTQADFENYRKRMAREQASAVERGVAKLAKELLPALDHLEIAVKSAEGHADVVKGFAIVRDEFLAALGKAGIQAFSPQGDPFDPNEHEAMVQQPAPEGVASGTVLEVYQQGYRINGSVLRPARVVVAA